MNHVEASLCFPTFPRFCGQTFTEAKDRELGLACVKAYNDWMVEEWCGDSGGALIPLDHHPAVGRRAGRRRGAPQRRAGRARGVLQRDPAAPRAAVDPLGRLGPVLRGLRGDARPPSTCTSARRRACRPRRADAPVAVAATLSFNNAMASMTDWLFSGKLVQFPDAEPRLLRGPDRLAAVHPRAGRHGVGAAPGVGRRERPRARAAVAPTTTGRSSAASSATATG